MTTVVQMESASETLRSLTSFEKIDYEEMFVAGVPHARRWSAERWARAAVEDAPAMRRFAPTFWRVLGLRMGPRPSPNHVNGWRIDAKENDWIRLEAKCAYATIHVILRVDADEIQEAMFIRADRAIAGPIWAIIGPFHRRAMPGLMRYAVKTL